MILLYLLLFWVFPHLIAKPQSNGLERIQNNEKAITYAFSGGRLGDDLLACLHARWLSYKYDVPFIYAPFPYSQYLVLHNEELHLANAQYFFTKKWMLREEKDIRAISGSALIIVPYFPEAEAELKSHPGWWPYQFTVDWTDPKFKQMIRKLIAPRFPITTLEMPKEPCHTVAVHVRKGGDFDPAHAAFDLPLKLPPDSFYIAAIRKMSELCFHREMYVYIFTDDLNPPKIMRKYQGALIDLPNIHLDCRKETNGPGANVLEDFFSIQKFDCLIRPESNYTIIAEKLKDFKIVICPKDPRIDKGVVYIDSLRVERTFLTK
jgi:hypothetical protein